MNKMNKKLITLAAVGALVLPAITQAGTIFAEGFSGSTLNSASPAAPTSTTMDYAVMSSKNATASSLLDLSMVKTSAGFAEMQGRFSATPVSIGSGESIVLQMTFKPTALLDLDGFTESLNVGLYNSGGVNPVPGGAMANGGMGSGTAYVTGYSQNWEGYVGRVGALNGGNSSQMFTRDAQTDTTDENQDVLFNNAGTGAFDNPTGQTVGNGSQILLTQGSDYTLVFTVLNTGTGVQVSEDIFAGIGTGGSSVYTATGAAPAGYEYTTFDALAFGFRGHSTTTAIDMDVSALSVGVIPEPATIGLVGILGAAMLFIRRMKI